MGKQVLLLGADGFIGRHIAFALRAAGWQVTACARRPERMATMGFETLRADLTNPVCATPEFWHPHLQNMDALVNAAGLLSAADPTMQAVHIEAPKALYAARPRSCTALLLSATGIDDSDTPFACYRRAAEADAKTAGVMILRPGLVLADTSYGGSSLARALAALPLRRPLIGNGTQPFNPIHAADLADVIAHLLDQPIAPGPHEIGGPQTITQNELSASFRRWLGLPECPALHIPLPLAQKLGRGGDAMNMGPISANAVAQLHHGVHAETAPALRNLPRRNFSEFVQHRPAGTQDLWHARLYLLRPALRLILALMWLISGLLGLFLPAAHFLPLLPDAPAPLMTALARLGGLADLAIALALLRNWRPALTTWAQLALVGAYTAAFTALNPALWLLPLGGLLKNLPVLALIALNGLLSDER